MLSVPAQGIPAMLRDQVLCAVHTDLSEFCHHISRFKLVYQTIPATTLKAIHFKLVLASWPSFDARRKSSKLPYIVPLKGHLHWKSDTSG